MINTNTSVASLLSNIYQTNTSLLSDSMRRISSGKRVESASDDFSAFIRAQSYNTDVNAYNAIKRDLQNMKGLTDYALQVGNEVVSIMKDMDDLKELYGATTDTDAQAGYTAQFNALSSRLTDLIANAQYDSTQVYQAGSLGTVQINPEDAALLIDVTPTNAADETNTALTDITDANAISTEITKGQTYLADVQSFSDDIARHMKLIDTAIASKEATVSALVDVDEAKEMLNVTNYQVRLQAAAAMMSQANVSQAAIARIFQ